MFKHTPNNSNNTAEIQIVESIFTSMSEKRSRLSKGSRNDEFSTAFSKVDAENMKRIRLLFDRIDSALRDAYPKQADLLWLSELLEKAKSGIYFVNIGYNGCVVLPGDTKIVVAFRGVDWETLTTDIRDAYLLRRLVDGNKQLETGSELPEIIMDEITYEVNRQSLEIPKPEVASTDHMKNLQIRNGQPIFPHKWKKEPYKLRKYDRISEYVPASCVDELDSADLQSQLVTTLDGYMGPAYNYDDTSLTEEWMVNFRDGMAEPPSVDDVIRTQIECLVEIMVGQVQDMVCNDLKVLAIEPVGLGARLQEKPVWGIDCNTNRTIELVLEEAYVQSSSGGADSEPLPFSNALFRRFIERVMLPAINAVQSNLAHRMDMVLRHIIQSKNSTCLDVRYADILLKAVLGTDCDEYFRIHPKGTGIVCTDPNGIPAHVVISEYLGEMYPPYRWCEKLDVVQQAQKIYELKPTLPDFYNILLERPRRDPAGYGLIFVDASQRANMGSSCSHSCDANCTSAVVARNGKLCIVLTTNRPVNYGEELCMDYYSITTSEVEWRAAICLCGSLACRGSFLHFATQDDLQQLLLQRSPPAARVASLIRGCTDTRFSQEDTETLKRHGMEEIALGHNSPFFIKRFAVDILRFLEYERRALPCALLRPKDGSPSPYTFSSADMDARCVLEQRMQSLVCCFSLVLKFLSEQTDDLRAKKPLRILSNQEAAASVWRVMQSIPKLLQKHVTKTVALSAGEDKSKDSKLLSAIVAIKNLLTGPPPTGMTALQESLRDLQTLVRSIHEYSTPTARLLLLSDVLSLWTHTSTYAVIEEYQPIHSRSIEVVARELGTTTIAREKIIKTLGKDCKLLMSRTEAKKLEAKNKLSELKDKSFVDTMSANSDDMEIVDEAAISSPNDVASNESINGINYHSGDSHKYDISFEKTESAISSALGSGRPKKGKPQVAVSLEPNDVVFAGSKHYPSTYPFWQLIGWFNAGTDQDSVEPDLFGTCFLPVPAACFGLSDSDYTKKERDILQTHLQHDRTQATAWPSELRKCFCTVPIEDEHNLIGSPVLDVSLGRVGAIGTCLDEMFGANRERRSDEDYTQFDNNLPPEMPTEWVQCEGCLKWRRVPFHVVLDDLPDKWYCTMNFWDEPEKANCEAPQDVYDPDRESTVDCSALRDGYVEPVEVGDWKDVYCVRNKIYYEAKAVNMRPSKVNSGSMEVRFHFKGWKPGQDEWIEVGSPRIAPYHFYTDATSRTVKDQEKWQGYRNGGKGKTNKASGKKRAADNIKDATTISAKKSRRKSK